MVVVAALAGSAKQVCSHQCTIVVEVTAVVVECADVDFSTVVAQQIFRCAVVECHCTLAGDFSAGENHNLCLVDAAQGLA